MRKLSLLVLMVLLPMLASADAVEIDGIYYNLSNEDNTAEVTSLYEHPYSGEVVLPGTVEYGGTTYNVTRIGRYSFDECDDLTSVIIGENVIYIDKSAFLDCRNLTTLRVESNLKYDSREDCNGIIETATNTLVVGCKATVIPNSVTSIGERAFGDCSALTSIIIPNSVTSIGRAAFDDCSGLTSLVIPNSVTNLGEEAFNGCSGLTSLTIGSGLTTITKESFKKCSGLTTLNIPSNITSIGEEAFFRCTGLTTLNIPNNVISIVDDAFEDCTGLTTVVIGSGLSSINYRAFHGCSNLNYIQVVNNTHFDSREGCNIIVETSTNTLVIGCKASIIPSSVKSIGERAFYDCQGLTSITIPEGVTSIGVNAFKSSGLNTVTIPQSVALIGEGAFSRCNSLTAFYSYADKVPEIGDDIFEGTLIESATLHVPEGSIEAYQAVEPWNGFKEIVAIANEPSDKIEFADEKVKALCVTNWDSDNDGELSYNEAASVTDLGNVFKYNTEITSFEELQYFTGLMSIDMMAFSCCTSLTTMVLPNSVTSIGLSAFLLCNSLTSITIPDGLTSIGNAAFEACSALTSVTIPNSVTSIGENAFLGCMSLAAFDVEEGNLYYTAEDGILFNKAKTMIVCYPGGKAETSYIIPNNVTEIGNAAFSGCTVLTSITIPSSVTTIGSSAFKGCSGLTSVNIPSAVTSIDASAFVGCGGITSITVEEGNVIYDSRNNCNAIIKTADNELIKGCQNTIVPNGVTTIGYAAFNGCSGMTSIVIPNSVTSISTTAFQGCSGLTTLTIPDGVTDIGMSAFESCSGLTSVNIPSNMTSIETYTFAYCSSLTSIIIPNGVTSIWDHAFDGCSSLTSVTIPDGVTYIGGSSFKGCSSLTSLTIPSSVTHINWGAFYGCSKITDVYCYAESVPETQQELFDSSLLLKITLHVPEGSIEAYQAAEPWNGFKEIVAIDSEVKPISDETTVNPSDEAKSGETVTTESGVIISLGENDSVDKENGCVTVTTKMTPDEVKDLMNQAKPDEPYFYERFKGMYSLLAAGKGYMEIKCQTLGDYELTVMQGTNKVSHYTKETKGTIRIKYAFESNEWVFLFPTVSAAARAKAGKAPIEGGLKIFSVKFVPDKKGDANDDGTVNADDIVEVVNYIMGHQPDNFNESNADANEDGTVNAADIVWIVNYIMGN